MSIFDGLPKSIRIGPFDIHISIVETIDDGDTCWGQYEHGIGIKLCRAHPSAIYAADTLMHEINHAVWRNAHFGSSGDEERVIAVMATGWAQVMRDNPLLLKWITGALKQ